MPKLAGPQLFSSKWLMRESFTSTNLNKIQPLLYENECPLSKVVYFCDQELAALWSWTTLLCMSFIPLIIQSLDYSVVVVLSQNLCLFRLPHKHIIYIIISPFGKSIKTPFFFSTDTLLFGIPKLLLDYLPETFGFNWVKKEARLQSFLNWLSSSR